MQSADPRPPCFAAWLLARTAPERDREALLGDMAEEFAARAAVSPPAARAWYRRQVAGSLAANLARWRPARWASQRKGDGMWQSLANDARFAAKTLGHNRWFAAAVIGTLALGIGASTVVFSMVDGLVLNPFPYPEPDRLVTVGSEFPKLGRELSFFENLSPAEFQDLAQESRALRNVVAWDMGYRQIASSGPPEQVFTAFWWGDAFPTLGMAPALGRGFSGEEIQRAERVAVISHRLWHKHFAADPGLLGRPLHVNGVPFTLVGVMPPRVLVYGTDLWIPMPVSPEAFPRGHRQFQVLARLAPGLSLTEAQTGLGAMAARTDAAHREQLPEYEGWRLHAATWTDANVKALRPAAIVLAGAVLFVLLLACANVATLLLARSTSRRREIAVRVALGANRRALLRQLLVESLVLALLGGAAGTALAVAGVGGLARALSEGRFLDVELAVDARVLLFALGASVSAGILFGLAPALHAVRDQVQGALRVEGSASTASVGRLRLQRVFVGIEVALATAILSAAGLLVHSFVRLQRVDPGFDHRGVLTFRLTLPRERYDAAGIQAFFNELVARLAAHPAVSAAAAGSQFPPMGFSRTQLAVEGDARAEGGELPDALTTLVSEGYFRTLGIPLLRGRPFAADDRAGRPAVAIVSESAARRFFGGVDAVGRRFRMGNSEKGRWYEIVGVAAPAANRGLDRPPEPEIYTHLEQAVGEWNQLFVLARTGGDPKALASDVRAIVRSLDPEQSLYAVQTVEQAFGALAMPRRIATGLVGGFAAFALALALSGIYSVVAFAAAARTREIGVRMAIGARASAVRALVVRQALPPVLAGIAAGLAGALAAARPLQALLFEVRGTDPLTLGAVSTLFALTALLAAYGPARHASRIDPVRALRSE